MKTRNLLIPSNPLIELVDDYSQSMKFPIPDKIQIAVQQGYWGTWKTKLLYNPQFYICGAQLQFEDFRGGKKKDDDTAANGVRFRFCHYQTWEDQADRQFEGAWGTWRGMVMCPTGWYASDFNARIERKQGTGDDTAFNGLKLRCKNPENFSQTTDITIFEGLWGEWSDWHFIDQPNFMLYALPRSQPYQGSGDDTAMNGLAVLMCV